jgi:predicted Zn-dependent peptidase
MRIIGFIEDKEVTRKIPKHLGLWAVKARPPPRANPPQFPYARPHQERLFIQKRGTPLDKREEG